MPTENRMEKAAYNYIEAYKELAIIEMYRTGIPASITIAQGLHESNYGQSNLATKANNHFGIKCKRYWNGNTYYHKDDDTNAQGKIIKSCFRAYDSALDSYVDHSNFLKHTEHYKKLFKLGKTDYRGWAHGLKKAGYATDKQYAQKLISKVEKYNLQSLDRNANPSMRKVRTY